MAQDLFSHVQEMLADGEDVSEYLFAFDPKDLDRSYVASLAAGVRGLLGRADLAPRQITSLARLLLGLLRLPLPTPGLDVELRAEAGGVTACLVALTEERLYVTRDGMATPFEVDKSYRSDTDAAELAWLDRFAELATSCELAVDDASDDASLDWERHDGSAFWANLPELQDDVEGDE